MNPLMKIVSISCKESTFLSSKRAFESIGILNNWKLNLHHKHCDRCKEFDVQLDMIIKIAVKENEHLELSEDEKNEIILKISENSL